MVFIVGDISYEGMHGDGESFLEEEDVKKPSVRPCPSLIEKNHVDELLLVEMRGEDESCWETLIVVGMPYDEGMDGEFFILEEEYDENKKYIDEPIVGMTCFEHIYIDHKEDECIIEEESIEESFYENYFLFEDQSKVDEDH